MSTCDERHRRRRPRTAPKWTVSMRSVDMSMSPQSRPQHDSLGPWPAMALGTRSARMRAGATGARRPRSPRSSGGEGRGWGRRGGMAGDAAHALFSVVMFGLARGPALSAGREQAGLAGAQGPDRRRFPRAWCCWGRASSAGPRVCCVFDHRDGSISAQPVRFSCDMVAIRQLRLELGCIEAYWVFATRFWLFHDLQSMSVGPTGDVLDPANDPHYFKTIAACTSVGRGWAVTTLLW